MLTAEGHDVVVVEDVLEVGFDALTESIAGRDLLIALTGAADSPWPWVAALDAIAVVRVALAHSGATRDARDGDRRGAGGCRHRR